MARANDVASYLVSLRNSDENSGKYFSLSNLKMQKILYFCQGVFHAMHDISLIDDYSFEAWPYGPVIPQVYSRFSRFGQNDISDREAKSYRLSQDQIIVINQVWNLLKNRDAFDLVDATHLPGSPWDIIYNDENRFDRVIPNELIGEYFLNIGAGVVR